MSESIEPEQKPVDPALEAKINQPITITGDVAQASAQLQQFRATQAEVIQSGHSDQGQVQGKIDQTQLRIANLENQEKHQAKLQQKAEMGAQQKSGEGNRKPERTAERPKQRREIQQRRERSEFDKGELAEEMNPHIDPAQEQSSRQIEGDSINNQQATEADMKAAGVKYRYPQNIKQSIDQFAQEENMVEQQQGEESKSQQSESEQELAQYQAERSEAEKAGKPVSKFVEFKIEKLEAQVEAEKNPDRQQEKQQEQSHDLDKGIER